MESENRPIRMRNGEPEYHQASAVETRGQKRQAGRARQPLVVPEPLESIVSVDNLIKAQREDESLKSLRIHVDGGDQRMTKQGNTTSFVYKNNVLYRKFIDVTPGSDCCDASCSAIKVSESSHEAGTRVHLCRSSRKQKDL